LTNRERKNIIKEEKLKNMLTRGLLALIVFSFFSCDQDRVFDNYKTIPNQWDKDSLIMFEFDLKSSSYNSLLMLEPIKATSLIICF